MADNQAATMGGALMSRRRELVARDTSTPAGVIAGATVGSVVGALLIFLCFLPFILRAKRQRAARRRGEDGVLDLEAECPKSASFLRPPFGDTLRRLSTSHPFGNGHVAGHGAVAHAAKESDGEGGSGNHDLDGNANEKPSSLHPPGVEVKYGLPSPVSPPSQHVASFDRQEPAMRARDASVPLSRETTAAEAEISQFATHSMSESYGAPSRQTTGMMSQGITEEPEDYAQDDSKHHSHRLSDSISRLTRRFRSRGSTRSSGPTEDTNTPRSPSPGPRVALNAAVSPPVIPEDVDTEARGEAYSYYHDLEAYRPQQSSPGRHGPPLSIPDVHAPAPAPPPAQGILRTFSSPTSHVSANTATPLSPVSPVLRPYADSPLNLTQRPTFGLSDIEHKDTPDVKSFSRRKDFPKPLGRMDSLPPQDIVADIPSPPLPSDAGPSINPMDIMNPTTETEVDWKVKQDLVKMSQSPSPVPEQLQPSIAQAEYVSQPTPDPTPEPDHILTPNIKVEGEDVDMAQETNSLWETPPQSSAASKSSFEFTPDTRHTPNTTDSPSPYPNVGHGTNLDASAQQRFPCGECDRVFDQYHKLNHHKRYHEKPHECTHPGCTMRFGTKTHLDRHVNDKHNKTRKYYCVQQNCPYSRQGGKSFPRKDNWRRHMQNKHNIQHISEPGPEYVDELMGGT